MSKSDQKCQILLQWTTLWWYLIWTFYTRLGVLHDSSVGNTVEVDIKHINCVSKFISENVKLFLFAGFMYLICFIIIFLYIYILWRFVVVLNWSESECWNLIGRFLFGCYVYTLVMLSWRYLYPTVCKCLNVVSVYILALKKKQCRIWL